MQNIELIKDILNKTLNIDINNVDEMSDRALFFAKDFLCDIETEDDGKTLSLSGISIPRSLRGKGLSKDVIKNLEDFSKNNGYSKFKVPAVISSRMEKTLKSLNYEWEEFNYPNFDASLYEEFDGFYGTYYKNFKEE